MAPLRGLAAILPFLSVAVTGLSFLEPGLGGPGRVRVDDPRLQLTGEFGKPWLNGSFALGVEDALQKALPSRQSVRVIEWPMSTYPEPCWHYLHEESGAIGNFSVFNVTYGDCDIPWVFCQHPRATVNITESAEMFGRLPVRLREYVRVLIALPSPPTPEHSVAFSADADVAVRSCCWQLRILAHEISHIMDTNATPRTMHRVDPSILPPQEHKYSQTERWQGALASDEAVATWYSRFSWAEHFAELAPQGILEALKKGAVGEVSEDGARKLRRQVGTWVEDWGHVVQGGRWRCDSRRRWEMPRIINGI